MGEKCNMMNLDSSWCVSGERSERCGSKRFKGRECEAQETGVESVGACLQVDCNHIYVVGLQWGNGEMSWAGTDFTVFT